MRRYLGTFIALFAALLLLYAVSAYYSVWRFSETIRAHDLSGMSQRVDFDAVRGSLKKQIRDHFLGVLAKKKNVAIRLDLEDLTAGASGDDFVVKGDPDLRRSQPVTCAFGSFRRIPRSGYPVRQPMCST